MQVKAFEEKRKSEKRETLRGYFSSVNTQAWLSFERIENPRWMNVTYDMETAKADIQAAVTAIGENVTTITASGSEFENEMLLEYQKTLNLGAAMRRGSELKRMKQEQESRKEAQEAAERARWEAQEKAERERAERMAQKKAETEAAERAEKLLNAEIAPEPTRVEEPQEAEQMLDFRCFVTKRQMIALRDWLNANGIRFCRVPKFGD